MTTPLDSVSPSFGFAGESGYHFDVGYVGTINGAVIDFELLFFVGRGDHELFAVDVEIALAEQPVDFRTYDHRAALLPSCVGEH